MKNAIFFPYELFCYYQTMMTWKFYEVIFGDYTKRKDIQSNFLSSRYVSKYRFRNYVRRCFLEIKLGISLRLLFLIYPIVNWIFIWINFIFDEKYTGCPKTLGTRVTAWLSVPEETIFFLAKLRLKTTFEMRATLS